MRSNIKTYLIQAVLFLITVYTTTNAGGFLMGLPAKSEMELLLNGLYFSIPFLGILTVHEFGHYITAKLYKVKVSLPYYIPFFGLIGTMGAFIRIQSIPKTRQQFFDIGIAGPLAGFVIAIIVLVYGFKTLPPADYIFNVHEEYKQYGLNYAEHVYKEKNNDSSTTMVVGSNMLFSIMEEVLVEDKSRIPNEYEMFHYPFLFAGYIALFFTALNLLPIGQLDGGHVIYGLLGIKKHKIVSDIFYTLLVIAGGIGLLKTPLFEDFVPLESFNNFIVFTPIYLVLLYIGFFARLTPNTVTNILVTVVVFVAQYAIAEIWTSTQGFLGYMIFAFVIGRFVGTGHPPAQIDEPLSTGRKILGWIAIAIFILCFSFQPLYVVG